MESRFRFLHFIIGILAFVAFLGTGIYMTTVFPDIYAPKESIRFLFRANHIYLLFSALLNLSLGMYFIASEISRLKLMQQIGSILIALMPFFFVIAFVVEPIQASPSRPITTIAVFSTVIGLGLHVATFFLKRRL